MSAPQPSRRERRRLEVRERILETALALFEARGYEATTVNEIAQGADIAYGTFFVAGAVLSWETTGDGEAPS